MTYDLHLATEPREFVDLLDFREGDPTAFHRTLPGYAVTALYDVPRIAELLGVGRVLIKDESERLGLPAFKMLGASWATARAIRREWFPHLTELNLTALRGALSANPGRGLAAATDGNHGRGVARMARLLGLRCTIFVPAGTAEARSSDIESEGATVITVEGSYDDAIARSAAEASDDVLVISDTSWEGYRETPTDVIVGYSTIFREVDAVLAERGEHAPNVVLFQSGVGSFAASGIRHYLGPDADSKPAIVIVEPTAANCLMRSARAGSVSEAPGPHPSTMAGLNCGLPSPLAWPVIRASTDAYLSIDDEWAHAAMRLLAEVGIVAGESGAASLGALLATRREADARRAIGLRHDAVVLIVNTEYATDPANYRAQLDRDAGAVQSDAPELRRASLTVSL